MTVSRTAEQRAAGSRTEGHFVTLGPRSNGAADLRKVKTLAVLNPVELCSDCSWPSVCEGDACCWRNERELAAEVGRYRKRERVGQLTGTVADIGQVARAAGRAHGELDAVERMVDEADRPITIQVDEPLPAANQQLMDVLGVTVTVKDGLLEASVPTSMSILTSPCKTCGERPAHWTRGRYSGLCEPCAAAKLPALVTADRAGVGPGPTWTRESAIAAIQAWAREHGHPPPSSHKDRRCPSGPTAKRLFGSWGDLIVAAGFERPTKATRYKDSSGSAPARPATEESAEQPDDQEPAAVATAAPAPLARVDQLGRSPADQAGEAGSKPAPRFIDPETPPRGVETVSVRVALLGVLDSLRVLVDAVLPEEVV